MNPSNPDHFSWHAVYNDPEGFARSLATENQSSPPSGQEQAYHPDSLHPYGRQAPPESFYLSFPEGRSDFSQTSGYEHDHQNEIATYAGTSSSNRYGHYDQSISFDDPSALLQQSPYHDIAPYVQPSASQHYSPYYPTAADEENYASHPYYSQDPAHLIHPQSTETSLVGVYETFGEYGPSKSLSPSHNDEPAEIAQASRSQHVDRQRLQALRDSFGVPLPGIRTGKFNESILSQSFQAFKMSSIEIVLRIAELGKIDHIIDNVDMSKICGNRVKHSLADSVIHLNSIMQRNMIGRITRLVPNNSYLFEKGENFHLVDVLCEAYAQVAHDLGITDISLRCARLFAMFYGNPRPDRKTLADKIGIHENRISNLVTDCNALLKKVESPLLIERRYRGYCLTFYKIELLPSA